MFEDKDFEDMYYNIHKKDLSDEPKAPEVKPAEAKAPEANLFAAVVKKYRDRNSVLLLCV